VRTGRARPRGRGVLGPALSVKGDTMRGVRDWFPEGEEKTWGGKKRVGREFRKKNRDDETKSPWSRDGKE